MNQSTQNFHLAQKKHQTKTIAPNIKQEMVNKYQHLNTDIPMPLTTLCKCHYLHFQRHLLPLHTLLLPLHNLTLAEGHVIQVYV